MVVVTRADGSTYEVDVALIRDYGMCFYPWPHMAVGDRIYVAHPVTARKARSSAHQQRKISGKVFASKRDEDGGSLIWRVS